MSKYFIDIFLHFLYYIITGCWRIQVYTKGENFMDLSTKVNIVLSVLSFILTAISIVTVVITLRQNNKMIENSSRPYVCVYFDYMQCGEPTGYFVVKNFGASSAFIDSLTYNDVIQSSKIACGYFNYL